MRARLIALSTDNKVQQYEVEGASMRLEVHGSGAGGVITDLRESDGRVLARTRVIGSARFEAAHGGGITNADPGNWHQGIPGDSIVTEQLIHKADPDELEAYGGYVICESVDPQFRPLIIASPQMLALLERIERHWSGVLSPADALYAQQQISHETAQILAQIRKGGAS